MNPSPFGTWVQYERKSMTMKNMKKENDDTCVSILCHSRTQTRASRNEDVKFMNKDIIHLDTREGSEYDNEEIVLENDNMASSPLSPSDSDTYTLSPSGEVKRRPEGPEIRSYTFHI